ncbi:MAG TPA: dihydrolipoamide acetyltransferase family protein [Chloroflexota bacterium]|nr:dihydrolipoamide acetyltransferase family protein [Chloroflexota bacterium]
MAVEVRLPQLAASMADGVISKWLKSVGQPVKKGESLFEVESDKVTTEVESPADGILRRIQVPEGQKVDVGSVLAIIGAEGDVSPDTNGGGPVVAATTSGSVAVAVAAPVNTTSQAKIFVTPRARKVAEERGVDVSQLQGTGPGGRILERDVLAAPTRVLPSDTPKPRGLPAQPPPPSPIPVAVPFPTPARADSPNAAPAAVLPGSIIPLTGIRRTIAERMTKSQQTVAEVTLTAEVDVGEIVKLRQQVGDEWQKQHGIKVSYNDVIIRAVARALREHPQLNSSLADDGIHLHAEINLGVAVSIDAGLIVPVIRDADRRSLLEIAQTSRALAERARQNQLTRDEVTGGTFTISNMGTVGVEAFTPIINWPECAILGVGQISERAVVRDGQILARPTMWLSLTFDHRIVDGVPAARFLARIRQLLESPYLLFV